MAATPRSLPDSDTVPLTRAREHLKLQVVGFRCHFHGRPSFLCLDAGLIYLPRVGRWEMSIVELDDKGRVLIPAEIRRKVRSRRFKVSARGDVVELEPLPSLDQLRGKYRDLIKEEWDELEEAGEDFVLKR